MTIRVGINGFGRIGRNFYRAALAKGADINLPDSRGYTAVDYAMGRAGGNSRGGQRIDVHKDTADLLMSKGGVAGTPVRQSPGR